MILTILTNINKLHAMHIALMFCDEHCVLCSTGRYVVIYPMVNAHVNIYIYVYIYNTAVLIFMRTYLLYF